MSQILPKSYTFQREKLLEPIRKASTLRMLGIPINTDAMPFENSTEIVTVTDDPKIGVAPEPISGVRSTNQLVSVIKKIPTISAPVSYGPYELQRINNGKLPFDARMEILAKWIADAEEGHAFAASSTGVRDSDAIPFIQGGTAVTTFDLVSGDTALTALAATIGRMIDRYGDLSTRPLVLMFNSTSWKRAMGLTSSKSDKTFMQGAIEMLLANGSPASGVKLVTRLANVMTQSDDVVSFANSTDETMALMLMDSNHFEIISSPIDTLKEEGEIKGLEVITVERWMPYVHDAESILYQLNVAIA